MSKVSIIMPSLNVANYITECMDSVLGQTLQDIEVLAIDAGSTDGTLEMLQNYACNDSRVKVIVSDKKSYGYQVNIGISQARGEYIGIVETDDIILPDMYETLYSKAIETGADYVKGTAKAFGVLPNGKKWELPIARVFGDKQKYARVFAPCENPWILLHDIYLWTGIYRRDFVSAIRLNESAGAAFQDQGFLFQTISSAQRAIYIEKDVYLYRQDNGNSSIVNPKGFAYLVEEYSYVEQFLQGKSKDWYSAYYLRMFAQCLGRFRTMAASGCFWTNASEDIEILRKRLYFAVQNQYLQETDMDEQRWKLLTMFLQEKEELYSHCNEELQIKQKPVQEVFEQIGDRQVVILGCGRYGKFFHALLVSKKEGQEVVFCDNNSLLWNTEIQGSKVLAVEDAVEQFPDAIYVIAMLKNTDGAKKQLMQLAIGEESICIFRETPNMLLLRM